MRVLLGIFLALAFTASPAFAEKTGSRQVYKYGWGYDSRWGGYYVGPIFKGNRKGYFRCLVPGYGWRRC